MNKLTLLTTIALLTPAIVVAEEAPAEEPRNWTAAAELGLISTNGNTKTTTLNAKLSGEITREKWTHSGEIESNVSEDQNETTAEKYVVSAKTRYDFNKSDYAYGRVTYEDDRFSGFDYQLTVGGGYGRQLIKNDVTNWTIEIGPGYRTSNPIVGDEIDEAVLFIGTKFLYKISNNAKFSQELGSDIGEESTITNSVTSLTAKVSNALAMKLSFNAKHTSEPAEGAQDLDTKTAATLVYSF